MTDVIKRLKEARKKIGLTQTAMAESIGIKPASYSEWERGVTNIPQVRLFQICTLHGISKEWLETGEGEMFPERIAREEYERETLINLGVKMFNSLPEEYRGVILSVARGIVAEAERGIVGSKSAVDLPTTKKEEYRPIKEQDLEPATAF